ncbi:hypothetical protein PVIIG_05227 [Plasmodium vivax India VII]|uniref:Variable surface protein n=1 Tax=Plasmodium vivax India VII TaxID=1077284 RepID=A0A0J9S2Q6_PLAVI|nr:hypothetical protein PVIIG_05227 [Plasmodium vivax India VII]
MSKDITNISNWKDNYPFLKNVSEVYDKFNNNEYVDTSSNSYDALCHAIINNVNGNVEKHKDICMKLMRNLGHYDAKTSFFNPSFYRCNILYNWIYNTIENSETTNKLIIKCFDDYISTMRSTVQYYNCTYDLFNSTYLEPRKITILNIFDNNIPDIIVKLNGEYNLNDSPSQNFVCECVNIYKEMYRNYCNDQSPRDTKHNKTCDRLNTFQKSYMEYIYNIVVKKDNIPSLEDVENEYMRKCQKNQPMPVLASSEDEGASESEQLTKTVRGNLDASRLSESINDGVRDNSLSPTMSTALGTVAGASSLLALLYKVTQFFI